jgi:hypothetical protein
MNDFEKSSVEVQYKICLFSLLKQNMIQSDTIIRKYIVFADNVIVTIMKYRLLFHYIDERIHQLQYVNLLTGNQEVHLENVLSGSVQYIYSFADDPKGLSKRQELLDQGHGGAGRPDCRYV